MQNVKKKLVFLSGAGISAESGIRTFRDANGLWEGYDVMEVASPHGWADDPKLVLEFYNQRRKQALTAVPNLGHTIIVDLEKDFQVTVITQNVDNLHEQAGSSQVIHLHGELSKSRSSSHPNLIYDINGWELNPGDLCEHGSQLRPDIVWFGEAVPMLEVAVKVINEADLFVVIGTSLQVYPAAGLIHSVRHGIPRYIIDPNALAMDLKEDIHIIQKGGSEGMTELRDLLKTKN